MENNRSGKFMVAALSLIALIASLILGTVAFNAGNILSIQKAAEVIQHKCEGFTK